MPVYLNSKHLLSIPQDDDSVLCENELYLTDPEMLYDRLPQPFRLINKIVNKICNNAWSNIVNMIEKREELNRKRYIESLYSIKRMQEEDIQCMIAIESGQIMMGTKNGLILWSVDADKQEIIDQWKVEGTNVCSLVAHRFGDNINLVGSINEDGSARLLVVMHGRMYEIKEFPISKDAEKPMQVTNIVLDDSCGTISVSYAEINDNEHWLEVHKVNREAWIKEIATVSKAYQEFLHGQPSSSTNEGNGGEVSNDDSSTILERNAIRVTPTVITMKLKFPDVTKVPGVSNVHQLYKQVDPSGSCIGLGLNHCVTKNVIDGRLKASNMDNVVPPQTELYAMRIANVRYIKTTGSLIPEVVADDNSENSYQMMIVWWSASQHLLMYALNRSVQKDLWVKPDGIRSFSCHISACEISRCNTLICVGLQNGLFSIIEISSGITRFLKQISNHSIITINLLHFQEDNHFQYMNVIDDKNATFCVKFNASLTHDNGEVVLLESDTDSVAIIPIGPSFDLTLSVYSHGPVILRDMFSGTAILKIELPENTTVSSPWQPIFACAPGIYLCLQALSSDGTDEDKGQQITLLFKLELDAYKYEPTALREKQDSDTKSFITKMADYYLNKRHGAHNNRQSRLHDCFINLHQFIRTPTTTVQ